MKDEPTPRGSRVGERFADVKIARCALRSRILVNSPSGAFGREYGPCARLQTNDV